MSLRTALEHLPHDRESEALLRTVLNVVRRREGEWIEPRDIAATLSGQASSIADIMDVLRQFFVLDFDDDPPRYSYKRDRVLEIEIDRFMRSAESRSGRIQNNVEKFRQRYGTK